MSNVSHRFYRQEENRGLFLVSSLSPEDGQQWTNRRQEPRTLCALIFQSQFFSVCTKSAWMAPFSYSVPPALSHCVRLGFFVCFLKFFLMSLFLTFFETGQWSAAKLMFQTTWCAFSQVKFGSASAQLSAQSWVFRPDRLLRVGSGSQRQTIQLRHSWWFSPKCNSTDKAVRCFSFPWSILLFKSFKSFI